MANHSVYVQHSDAAYTFIFAPTTAATWADLAPTASSNIEFSTNVGIAYFKQGSLNYIGRILFKVNTKFLQNSTLDTVTIQVPFVKSNYTRSSETFVLNACTITDADVIATVGPNETLYRYVQQKTLLGEKADIFNSVGTSISAPVTVNFSSVSVGNDPPLFINFTVNNSYINKDGSTYFWLVYGEDGAHTLPTQTSNNSVYTLTQSDTRTTAGVRTGNGIKLTSISTSVATSSDKPSGIPYLNTCQTYSSTGVATTIEVAPPLNGGTSKIIYYDVYNGMATDNYIFYIGRALVDTYLDYRGILTRNKSFDLENYIFVAMTEEGLESLPSSLGQLGSELIQINPPTNLRILSKTTTSISIAWNAPEGGDPFTKYIVKWRSPDTDSVCYTSLDLPTSQTTYTIDVPADIRLNFNIFVFAANASGASSHLLGASLIGVNLNGAPAVVTAPTNVAISNITPNAAVLTAQQPTSIGTGIKQYNVYLTNVSTSTVLPVRINNINPYFPFDLLNLTANTNYSVQVSLTDLSDTEGPRSGAVTFTTPITSGGGVVPSAPQNVVASIGSAPNAVRITWVAPQSTNGTLTQYVITNKVNSNTKVVSVASGLFETTFSPLDYGVTYSFGVKVNNETGYSAETISNPITLVAPVNKPSAPQNVSISVVAQNATVNWTAPFSDGGSPITFYKVSLFSNKTTFPAVSTVDASTFTFTMTGLDADTTYYYTVAATNSTVEPYLYGSEAVSLSFNPTQNISGSVVVTESFNYKKFFSAPVILDKNAENYGDFIYPETVTSVVPSSISNDDLQFPITLTTSNNILVLLYKKPQEETKTYYIPINSLTYNTFTELIDELQLTTSQTAGGSKIYPVSITGLVNNITDTNKLLMESADVVEVFALSEENPVIVDSVHYTNVNSIIFGSNPVYFEGYAENLVENHIPIGAYDNKNSKALVESRPIVTRKDLVVTYKLAYEDKPMPYIELANNTNDLEQALYQVTVANTPLRPTKVDIFWYNVYNQYTHLVDYNGDGVLLERIKSIDEFGNVTFTFEPTTVGGYGQINYQKGTINNLVLKNYRPASILGSGVKFPITVRSGDNLVLNIRGSLQSIPIAAGTYSINALISYLNTSNVLPTYQLRAGYMNGQLFIVNKRLGPNETLTLNDVPAGNLTLSIFGFNPILVAPPKIYISYSYSLNQSDKYQHIWYQTPHFVIRVKNRTEDSLFTQAHLNYILQKIDKFRPTTAVLNGIEVNIETSDTANVYENMEFISYPRPDTSDALLTPPYIIVSLVPPAEGAIVVGPNDVEVMNPDGQFDVLDDGYTYLLNQ